jgi:hypothetical protein
MIIDGNYGKTYAISTRRASVVLFAEFLQWRSFSILIVVPRTKRRTVLTIANLGRGIVGSYVDRDAVGGGARKKISPGPSFQSFSKRGNGL